MIRISVITIFHHSSLKIEFSSVERVQLMDRFHEKPMEYLEYQRYLA